MIIIKNYYIFLAKKIHFLIIINYNLFPFPKVHHHLHIDGSIVGLILKFSDAFAYKKLIKQYPLERMKLILNFKKNETKN